MVNFFGMALGDAVVYSIWLHTGTLFAAIVYFRDDVLRLLGNFPAYVENPRKKTAENRLTTFLIISTSLTALIGLPIVLFGIETVDITGAAATAFIGILLIFTGILQKYSRSSSEKRDITVRDSALVGGLQAFSVLPGISRSGITVSVLLLRKYKASDALKLSFLMSIPAVLVAQIGIALFDRITLDVNSMVSIASSFVVGLLSIDVLLKIAGRINFGNFCIFLGVLSMGAALV